MSIAIKDHDADEVNEAVYVEAMAVWESLFLFNNAVTRGCDDNDHVAVVEAHAHELDNLGAMFLATYLAVAADSRVTVYMHTMTCHMGDLEREWGGLMKWCSQKAEAMHQMTQVFARKRSARRGDVSKIVLTRLPMAVKMRAQPSRKQQVQYTGKQVTCNGHDSKAKKKVHEQTQNKLEIKYPAHNFNESRAVKRARGE
jgi:hypothetical protein